MDESVGQSDTLITSQEIWHQLSTSRSISDVNLNFVAIHPEWQLTAERINKGIIMIKRGDIQIKWKKLSYMLC